MTATFPYSKSHCENLQRLPAKSWWTKSFLGRTHNRSEIRVSELLSSPTIVALGVVNSNKQQRTTLNVAKSEWHKFQGSGENFQMGCSLSAWLPGKPSALWDGHYFLQQTRVSSCQPCLFYQKAKPKMKQDALKRDTILKVAERPFWRLDLKFSTCIHVCMWLQSRCDCIWAVRAVIKLWKRKAVRCLLFFFSRHAQIRNGTTLLSRKWIWSNEKPFDTHERRFETQGGCDGQSRI